MAHKARILLLVSVLGGFAPHVRAQSEGIAPEWDVRKNMAQLSSEVQRLKPILGQLDPNAWLANGAPEAYVGQHKLAQAEIEYLAASTEKLAREPEKLPLALDTMFRMQSVEALVGSLSEGVRKYQNAGLADQLRSTLTSNVNNREKLRTYIVDLATAREQEFAVAHREAQRCRSALSRQAPRGSTQPGKAGPAAKKPERQ